MPRASRTELIERRLAEEDPRSAERYLDFELVVFAEDDRGKRTSTELCRVGGLWDKRRKEYTDDAKHVRVMSVHPGQIDAMVFFDSWLKDHISGRPIPEDDRIYSALFAGGQRSGKTWEGVLCCVLYATAIPGSIVWIVCPSDRRYEEVEDLLHDIMPLSWYSELGSPWHRFRLKNGSKIVLRSGHLPGSLKNGDCDFLLINEAQQQSERVFAICRTRIAAAGGLVLCAANPPDQNIGTWVGDFATEAQAGRRQAKFFFLDPMDNPHIDRAPLIALQQELDPHTYDVDVRGLFLGSKNAVLYNWDRIENERPPGQPKDATKVAKNITREFLHFREGRAFDRVVAVDMQRLPHMASVEGQLFENSLAPSGPERFEWCHLWFTADVTIEGADEADLCMAWLELGWDPDRTLLIADASGKWQFAEREPMKVQKLREEVKGRGSWDVFRKMGFKHVVNPDRNLEKNPDVIERCRATTSRICTKAAGPYGRRFVYSDPSLRDFNKALRLWPTKGGAPMRTSQYAHRGDTATYMVHRLFPRRQSPTSMDVKIVTKPQGKGRMAGW